MRKSPVLREMKITTQALNGIKNIFFCAFLCFEPLFVYAQTAEKEIKHEIFDIIFHQDFENTPPGPYNLSGWKKDWNNPAWANRSLGYGHVIKSNNNNSLRISLPKGKKGLDSSGVQWQTVFKKGYDELYFSYRIKFSSGFKNKKIHGKIPGLSGASSNTGGKIPTGSDGWSARYMFHGTDIFFYLYYPEMYRDFGDIIPDPKKTYYGAGVNLRPGFTLQTDEWYTITQRIVMNSPGSSDGLVEGYINGRLCAAKTNMRFRDTSSIQIDRIYFANFLGGSGVPPIEDEYIEFDDFYVFCYKPGVDVPRNNVRSPNGRLLELPGRN